MYLTCVLLHGMLGIIGITSENVGRSGNTYEVRTTSCDWGPWTLSKRVLTLTHLAFHPEQNQATGQKVER